LFPVTDRFLNSIRYSHTKMTRVDLYRDQQPLVTSLPLLTASVTDDYTADVRRRCDVTLAGTEDVMDLLPTQAEGEGGLWPIGNEIRIRSGIVYSDGDEELVPMGVFRIANPVIRVGADGDRVVSIKGYDRSRAVSRARFIEPYQIAQSAFDVPLEIKALVKSRIPTMADDEFILMSSDYDPPPRAFLRDNDPWKDAAVEMAKGIGAEVLFDGLGRLVVRPAPDPIADPVTFSYVEGEDCTLLDLDRALDDEQGYNGVVASSQSTDNEEIFEGQFWDTDSTSPTYFDPDYPEKSIYGQMPYFYVSEFIRTDQQAKDAAKGIFGSVTGILESYDFTAICNPAHESGDTIRVIQSLANADDVNLAQVFNFNLTGGTMTVQTRRRAIGGNVTPVGVDQVME
jgi:hypothetical protein